MLRGGRGAELEHGEAREVLHGRRHVARGNQAADVADLARLSRDAGKAATVAAREAWIVRGDTVHDGARHAERLEEAALELSGGGQGRGGGGDDFAGEGHGEVRVLPLRLRLEGGGLAQEALAHEGGGRKLERVPVGEGGFAR